MATALISDTQKNTIKSIIDDIHETFARNITVFEEGRKVLIAASPEFNGVYVELEQHLVLLQRQLSVIL